MAGRWFLTQAEVVALVVAPLVAPIGFWLAHVAIAITRVVGVSERPIPGAAEFARSLFVILAFGAPIAWIAAILCVPVYVGLRILSPRPVVQQWRYAILVAGAVIGALTSLTVQPALRGELVSVTLPWWAGAVLGLLSAAVFVRLAAAGGHAPG